MNEWSAFFWGCVAMTAKEANAFGKIVMTLSDGATKVEAVLGLDGKWRSDAFPVSTAELDFLSSQVPHGPADGFYGAPQVNAAAEKFGCQAVVYDLEIPDLPDDIVF